MIIGLDLSSLQGPHRMRGVGYTLINFINNIPAEQRKQHSFVFYYYVNEKLEDPLELLDLQGLQYEVRPLQAPRRLTKILPGKFNIFIRLLNQLISLTDLYFGDTRLKDTSGLQIFLQTDQMMSLPRGRFQKAFIAYDVIPYVLEWDYLWDYQTARSHGLPRQAAIRCQGRRWLYIHKLRVNSRRANKILAISETTRADFTKYVGTSKKKLITTPLGINAINEAASVAPPQMHHYASSSWGYLRRPYRFEDDVSFLLFVGGVDHRRKLQDVITAFNHLRARGHNLRLVLTGDIMHGPLNIPVYDTQKALQHSSYLEDIIFMGFVDNEQRDWLYKNALAFIFPSKYEGFGLPVIEAMQRGTPVIAYKNSACYEVAEDAALYADNQQSIREHVETLLTNPAVKKKFAQLGQKQAAKYSWSTTSKNIIKAIT